MSSSSSPCTLNPDSDDTLHPWRYSWEALAHIPTLRLYLFGSLKVASLSAVSASLQSARSLLSVSLSYRDGPVACMELPLPPVLIEFDQEILCLVRSDHVEIKIKLLLPLHHPLVAPYRASLGFHGDYNVAPLSLNNDLKSLSSGDVNLYCKSCSTKLTKQSLRHIVEMPSLNWRDVAENWYGNCCCSFGAAAENLATQYLNSFNLSPDIGLLSPVSVTVSKDSLHGYPHKPANQEPSLDLRKTNHANPKLQTLVPCNCSHDEVHDPRGITDTSKGGHLIHTATNCDVNSVSDSYNGRNMFFGGGFVHHEANISKDVKWIEFCCEMCSSPLGSYPCQKDMGNPGTIDGGVRLFKCYISTSIPTGGPGDAFRYYKVQNLFSNLLLESAEDEVSFRTVVRDLESRKPVLQLVLLSSKAWYISGTCIENQKADSDFGVQLKPVAKVLFSDCNDASEADIRSVENWSAKYHAEDLYMMTREIGELKNVLNFGNQSMPLSCSYMQGMHLSWLDLHGF